MAPDKAPKPEREAARAARRAAKAKRLEHRGEAVRPVPTLGTVARVVGIIR